MIFDIQKNLTFLILCLNIPVVSSSLFQPHQSIHSSILIRLHRSGRRGSKPSRLTQTSLSTATLSSSLWGIQRRVLCLPRGLLPVGRAWKWEVSRRPPNLMPEPSRLTHSTWRSCGSYCVGPTQYYTAKKYFYFIHFVVKLPKFS